MNLSKITHSFSLRSHKNVCQWGKNYFCKSGGHSIPYNTIPYPSIPYHTIMIPILYQTIPYYAIPYQTRTRKPGIVCLTLHSDNSDAPLKNC